MKTQLKPNALVLALFAAATVGLSAPAHAQDYPEDDVDDAFVGQDAMFGQGNPLRLMYLGAYAGLAEITVPSRGLGAFGFGTGFRFDPEWSAGIFATVLPEVQTILSYERAALFGAELHYHLDEYVPGTYVGATLAFLSAENTADFGMGLKAAYDFQLTRFFWLSGQVQMFLNPDPDETGHVFMALLGVKFQRGKK